MNKKTKALTLVELLVVILIVAALAAIVIPHLPRRHINSQRAACMNNLKQIGAGLQLYIDGPGGGRFYPYPMQAGGVAPEEAEPGKGFSGAAFIASLYWAEVLTDPRVFICASSFDDNRDGLDLCVDPENPESQPGYGPHFNKTGVHVSYASKAQWKMPGGLPMSEFPAKEIIAADSSHPLREEQNHTGGAMALFGDGSARFVEFPKGKSDRDMIGKQAPFDMIDN